MLHAQKKTRDRYAGGRGRDLNGILHGFAIDVMRIVRRAMMYSGHFVFDAECAASPCHVVYAASVSSVRWVNDGD